MATLHYDMSMRALADAAVAVLKGQGSTAHVQAQRGNTPAVVTIEVADEQTETARALLLSVDPDAQQAHFD